MQLDITQIARHDKCEEEEKRKFDRVVRHVALFFPSVHTKDRRQTNGHKADVHRYDKRTK